MKHKDRVKLHGERFHAYIDSSLRDGSLSYGEFVVKGKTDEEVLVSSYICHPSMANDECSGIAVSTFLAKWIMTNEKPKYTYRFVFAPETIGAVVYIARNYKLLKKKVKFAFNLTCIGDENNYSFMPSRTGNTQTDKAARYVFEKYIKTYKEYSFEQKGSDERQYCHPLVDLPMVTIMRSKYGCYHEYHTSLDDLTLVTAKGLEGGLDVVKKCIQIIEKNFIPANNIICEPMFSKRNLRPENWAQRELVKEDLRKNVSAITSIISNSDGTNDLIDISRKIDMDFFECEAIVEKLVKNGVIQ